MWLAVMVSRLSINEQRYLTIILADQEVNAEVTPAPTLIARRLAGTWIRVNE